MRFLKPVAFVCTFHRVFSESGSRIGWKQSYDISLAGAAASRIRHRQRRRDRADRLGRSTAAA